MTSTMGQDQIVKMDRIGRIKTPRERREVLLAEFDQSGMSGQQFAKWAGIKYGTFITWVQKRRRKGALSKAEAKLVSLGLYRMRLGATFRNTCHLSRILSFGKSRRW